MKPEKIETKKSSLTKMFVGHAFNLLIDLAALCIVVIKFCFSPVLLLLAAGNIIFRQISNLFTEDSSTRSKIHINEDVVSSRGVFRTILVDEFVSSIKQRFRGATLHVSVPYEDASESALDDVSAFQAALDAPVISFAWISISLVLEAIRVIGDALTLVSSAFIYPTFALSCAFKGQSYEVESTKASELEQFKRSTDYILSRCNAPKELRAAFSLLVGK